MNPKIKFALGVGGWFGFFSAVSATFALIIWSSLDEAQRATVMPIATDRADIIFVLGFLLLVGVAFVLIPIFSRYVSAPRRLAEGVRVIATANPSHRVLPEGSSEVREVAEAVNLLAERYEGSLRDLERRISEAKQTVEEEKDRLAALMSELTQSVLVCNLEGRILLYNARAKQILTQPSEGVTHSMVGLGRSIFAIIDRSLITHGVETLNDRLQRKVTRPVANFVTSTTAGQLIRAQMAPVVSSGGEITGYVLTLDDIRRSMESSGRRDQLLQSLTEGSRSALANIRAAVEMLQSFPDMDGARQAQFIRVIAEEVHSISQRLDQVVGQHADSLKTQWPLEDMLGADLVAAAQRRIERRVGIPTKADTIENPIWLRVDSYSLVQSLTYLASRLHEEFSVREVRFRLTSSGRHAHLDLIWTGATMGSQTILTWETEPMILGGEASPLLLKDVIDRHGGEVWFQVEKATHRSYFRLLLPIAQPEEHAFSVAVADSRPEYYDFDLFHQPGQTPELDNRRLADLAYTVFDTETTGLDPSNGDEILSLGAVRIVNNRLLQHEAFDQLVDPQRPVSLESIKVTGIDPVILKGQPTIDRVLPAFHRFCEDTVLVAHNAAFDMRFLQLKEASSGIRFTQPVLDTLLLSAVLHPNLNSHKLEAIAERLGVNVLGRHTALGDAIVTGEVFLKMIPQLAERGIVTLKDAREAAEKTFYARIEY
jgi:DNA polymerase III subunit epsilon